MMSCKAETVPSAVDTNPRPPRALWSGFRAFSGVALHTSTQLLLLDCFPGRTESKSEQVAKLGLLGRKVARVFGGGRRDERHSLDDPESIPLKSCEFRRIVAHQSDGRQPEGRQDLRAHVVATRVDRQPELEVCLHGVAPLVLKAISVKLVDEPDSAPFVTAQVDDHALPGLRDALERGMKLRPAVAPLRPEQVARDALGMNANQHVGSTSHVPPHERDVLATVEVPKDMGDEWPV